MDPQVFKILVFTIWFILPLLPAFILYRFLPGNQVAVKGPFKGLKVDMAGAFAGYFLLFIGSYFIAKEMIFEKKADAEIWTMIAYVTDENQKPLYKTINKPDVTIHPSTVIEDGGAINEDITVKIKGNYYDFPGISITANANDTGKSRLFLSGEFSKELLFPDVNKGVKRNGHWIYDWNNRIIKYDTAIILSKEPPAVSAAAAKDILDVDSTRN